jgi:hypothetical protein
MVERHVHSLGTVSPAIFVYIKIPGDNAVGAGMWGYRTLAR